MKRQDVYPALTSNDVQQARLLRESNPELWEGVSQEGFSLLVELLLDDISPMLPGAELKSISVSLSPDHKGLFRATLAIMVDGVKGLCFANGDTPLQSLLLLLQWYRRGVCQFKTPPDKTEGITKWGNLMYIPEEGWIASMPVERSASYWDEQ